MTQGTTIVSLEGVTKRFAGATVVRSLDLDVQQGEFFSLLGPSGCGKTTTLRMIAGFSSPDAGRILLEGHDVTRTPPYRRNVNTVFQSYALFEHLTVAQNIGFGLKRQRVRKEEIRRRVGEMLELVDLGSRAHARPSELSGGQKQRVALARSIVNMPKVLLLDEPLGALDLKLRRQMQGELKRIQREVGITFVYVTHDQEEALSMSDRIGVMNDGQIEQLASPAELYDRPMTPFVAGFIGSTNLIEARIEGSEIAVDRALRFSRPPGVPVDLERVMLSVRPEHIRLGVGDDRDLSLDGVIAESAYLGYATHLTVQCDTGQRVQVAMPAGRSTPAAHQPGSRATISWRIEDTVIVPIP